ncbi:MAG: hypothetical protein CR961_01130 [Polaribacter sp.]|nr:MAG: hypothetical protein CR961_01130 [Polaribacter sp.]
MNLTRKIGIINSIIIIFFVLNSEFEFVDFGNSKIPSAILLIGFIIQAVILFRISNETILKYQK